MGRVTLLLSILCFIINPTRISAANDYNDMITEHEINILKNELPLLKNSKRNFSPLELKYLKHYELYFEKGEQYFGKFRVGDFYITSQIFMPERPKGTVLILHGYFDHAGVVNNLIKYCLDKGFGVAVYDLPGHGLSGGKTAEIDKFSDYTQVLKTFLDNYLPSMPKPYYLIGHSTGCAVAMDYFKTDTDTDFQKIIFIAPLVRSARWHLSKAGFYLLNPFKDSIVRVFRNNSGNPGFLHKVKNDPLQSKRIPLSWIRALYSWEKDIDESGLIKRDILIIQGTDDSVVDWKYNVSFLNRKFRSVDSFYIRSGKHQLLNETDSVLDIVLERIGSELLNHH